MKFNKKRILLVVLVLLLIGGTATFQNFRSVDLEVEREDYIPISERGYENPDVLISPFELNEIRDRDDVKIIDFRRGVAYRTGHIPDAIQVWRSDVTDPDHEYAGMRPSADKLVEWLSENGISESDTVVVYTSGGGHDAARMWWMMTMIGHEDVRLLDGGLDYWKAIDKDLAMSSSAISPADYDFAGDYDTSWLADVEDVKAAIDDDNQIILDTRSWDEHIGESDRGSRSGRIPSPYFVEWTETLNQDNLIMTADELKEVFESEGVTSDKAVINYCQSGVRSSHTTLVLSQLLGYEDVKNYDGSWIEWSARDDLEIETGE